MCKGLEFLFMGKTKKVGKAGRFGSKYGVGIRKRLLKVESKQQRSYDCPFCGFKRVKRKAGGLYECRKCNAVFAGGAYFPSTLPGTIIRKTVAQKSFSLKGKNLEELVKEAASLEEELPGKKKEKEGQKEE